MVILPGGPGVHGSDPGDPVRTRFADSRIEGKEHHEHLRPSVLFPCAAAVAVGACRPVGGGIAPGDVALIELRGGVPTGITVEQIENQAYGLLQIDDRIAGG